VQIFTRVRVVDLSTGMAGPLASMMLADHGADVIKVEPPSGDWTSTMPAYVQWNRGKRIVRLDLHDAVAAGIVADLVRTADVVLVDGNARLADRLGLDAGELARVNPGLITCSITPFGRAHVVGTRAYEGVIAASTGRMTNLDQLSGGQPGVRYDEPAFTAAPVASFGASQLALQGIVAALLQRESDGRGQHVSTSLVQGAMAFMMRQELGRASADAPATTIAPAAKRGIELCFLTAECADGRYIQMCARQDKHFRDWLTAVGLDEVLREPRYAAAPMGIPTVADVDELEVRLRERMRTKTQAEWMRVFVEEFDVGADPFLTPSEFLSHADMVANGRVVDIADPVLGTVRELGPLVQMAATPARIDRTPVVVSPSTVAWHDVRMPLPSSDGADDRVPPLRGVTIVEVAYYVAGPLATAILAEMGARVIKVEPLDGDPYRRTGLQSAKFLHGKESLTLDLKQPQGRAILDTLIDRADVVVHSFRAAAARKLGLDPATVHERNPGAVHLYAASYGSLGPQRDRAAFHSTPNALTGGGIKQAGRGNPPVNDSYADPGSALGAATAIMFGLWAKTRTGAGQALETTMLASTGYIHSADMVEYAGAPEWRVADGRQRGLSSRYRLYRCSTGYIFLAAVQEREWAAVLDAIERPDLAGWVHDDEELAAELEHVFRSRTPADWVTALAPTRVGVAEVFPGEFDRWLEEHDRLIPMDHPAFGPYWRLEPKIDLSRSSPQLRPACALGEQSREVLGELGFDQPAIDEMIATAVTTDGRMIEAR